MNQETARIASRNVLLVYPEFPSTYWGFQHLLSIVQKKAMHPPLSLITVAALCPPSWEFRLVDMNVEPLGDEQILWADMVFLSGMEIQLPSLLETLDRCRALGRTTVVGGPMASSRPEIIGDKADVLVLDEAEITIGPFLRDLEDGALQKMYRTRERPDITSSPVPRYDLLDLKAYATMDVQYSRGCPFNCEFCLIVSLYGHKPRTKTPEQILAEFDALYRLGYRGDVFVVDDNFIGNRTRVKDLLGEIIRWQKERKYPFILTTEASIDLADDDLLMENMRLAGFSRVFVGIESPSLESLQETHKYQNAKKDMLDAVARVIDSGIEVTGGFILGFDNDPPDIFQRQIDFIEDARIPWAMVGTLHALPGTRLWDRMEKEGRLREGVDINDVGRPNFRTKMGRETIYRGYLKVLQSIYSPEMYYGRVLGLLERQERSNRSSPYANVYPLLHPLRALYTIGVKSGYRRVFWKYMAKVIRRYPGRIVQALTHAIAGHHFITYTAALGEADAVGTVTVPDRVPRPIEHVAVSPAGP